MASLKGKLALSGLKSGHRDSEVGVLSGVSCDLVRMVNFGGGMLPRLFTRSAPSHHHAVICFQRPLFCFTTQCEREVQPISES